MVLIPRLLFLIPAHNEELLLAACITSVKNLDYPEHEIGIVVIADNCTDSTEQIARSNGASVLPRHDLVKLGKSEAIGWALGRVDLDSWDAVVILDADSIILPEFAGELAKQAPLRDKVVQANFGSSNEFDSWLTRLSGVLGRIRYELEYPRKQRLGLNVPLTGNGMCIGTAILIAEGWAADSITENWELYARWTAAGIVIRYAQDARLLSQESATLRQSSSQRLRWASGRAEVFRKWRAKILQSQRITPRQKIDAIVVLGSPSPIIGSLIALVLGVGGLAIFPRPVSLFLVIPAVLVLVWWSVSTFRVLRTHPQPIRTLTSLVMLPSYALWRGALQVKSMVVGTSRGWIRTARR